MAGPLRSKRNERLDSDALIADQIAYYRARAAEYDETLNALGRYVRVEGTVGGNDEGAEISAVINAIERLQPFDRVLELACGTGWWTQWLAGHARQVTAVDAAEEMLAINEIRVRSPNVRRILADVFSWTPDRQFDLVFFAFWLSHVPQDRFAAFWQLLGEALAPGGRVFFVDELDTERNRGSETRIAEDAVLRDLGDGRQFRAVKVFYEPSELELKLRQLGWEVEVEVHPAGRRFYWGQSISKPSPA
jgi:SAM-dependent methyltransferase